MSRSPSKKTSIILVKIEFLSDKASNKEAVNPQEEETKAAEEKKSAPNESPAFEEVKDDDATSEAKASSEQTEE